MLWISSKRIERSPGLWEEGEENGGMCKALDDYLGMMHLRIIFPLEE